MTEILLNAILNLFAIQASMLPGEKHEGAGAILRDYLTRYLHIATPDTYLELFDVALSLHADSSREDRTAQASLVAANLKPELPRLEQYVFLLRYLELAAKTAHGQDAGEAQDDLSEIVAREFGIPENLASLLRDLCRDSERTKDHPELLRFHRGRGVIGTSSTPQLARTDFQGDFGLVRLSEVNRFVVFPMAGTTVSLDSIPLLPGSPRLLPEGAILRDAFGARIYSSELAGAFQGDRDAGPPLVFEGRDLEFRYPGSENGLHNFSFTQRGGGLVGVMGVSGAGKSTLLGLLNGQMRPDSGQVLVGGVDLHAEGHKVEGVIGYVPQDDLLFEDLTVFDNLYYSASLCMDHLGAEERRQRVDTMLEELQQPGIRDLKVGSPLDKTISGGQRKRLNIALELIREPSILFVDEPTSGLSSSDSENVMSLLAAQAAKGRLVIVVIHQPSSRIFKMFDTLWILDQGGRPIYDGNPLDAIVHFRSAVHQAGMEEYACPQCGSVNPEQLFEIIEAREVDDHGRYTSERRISPEKWHRTYLEARDGTPPPEEQEPAEHALPESRLWQPSFLGQLGLFFARQAKGRLANRQYLAINLLEPPLLALLAALISHGAWGREYLFRDNPNLGTYLFISVIVALFLGMSVSAEEINRDRAILRREEFLHLSRPAYLASKLLYLALVAALQMGLFVLVGNPILELPDMYGPCWLVLFSCAMVSSVLGLNISDSFRSAVTIYILIPLILVPQMMLGGAVVPLDELIHADAGNRDTPLVADIMPSRWGYEALMVKQYTDNKFMRHFLADDCARKQAGFQADYLVPELRALADYPLLPRPEGLDETGWKGETAHGLRILANELRDLGAQTGIMADIPRETFTPAGYDSEGKTLVKQYLREIASHYRQVQKEASGRYRATEERLTEELGREGFEHLKNANFNQDVANLVLNRMSFETIRRSGDHIVQVALPICADGLSATEPGGSESGSPLFVARKRLGPVVMTTYGYNLMVLWAMAGLLVLTLRLRLLPRLLALGGRLS